MSWSRQTVVIGTVSVSNFPADQLTHATNLDVALSTRTKPADQQHAIVDSSALPSGAALDASVAALLHPADTLAAVTTVGTITNPVAVTGTFYPATQAVSGSMALSGDALNALLVLQRRAVLALFHPERAKLARRKLHA